MLAVDSFWLLEGDIANPKMIKSGAKIVGRITSTPF